MSEPENTDEIQRINGKFAPGVSGNPAGKPKGSKHLSTMLLNALKAQSLNGKTYDTLFIERVLNDAIVKGKPEMVRLVMNYVDGMPAQGIDLTTDGERIDASGDAIMKMAAEISAKLKKQKTDCE
jgi:hypothetical protein